MPLIELLKVCTRRISGPRASGSSRKESRSPEMAAWAPPVPEGEPEPAAGALSEMIALVIAGRLLYRVIASNR